MRKTCGFSIVELLIAIAILSVIVGGSVTLIRNMESSQRSMRVSHERDLMRLQIERLLSDPDSIIRTIDQTRLTQSLGGVPAGNRRISQCIFPDTITCGATNGVREFTLIDRSNVPQSGGRGLDMHGAPCQPTSANRRTCLFEVRTYFAARCRNAGLPCDQADFLMFYYLIRQRPDAIIPQSIGPGYRGTTNMCDPQWTTCNANTLNLAAVGVAPDAITIRVADLYKDRPSACPAGQVVVGWDYDNNNKLICAWQGNPCPAGQILTRPWVDPNNHALGRQTVCVNPLEGQQCPTAEYLAGVDASGNIICRRYVEKSESCPFQTVLQGFNSAGDPICVPSHQAKSCPADTWLIGFQDNGQPICKKIEANSGISYTKVCQCGHNHGWCNYNDPTKPPGYCQCDNPNEERTFIRWVPGHCCASCGTSIGQWWCDETVIRCTVPATGVWQ